MDLIVCTVVSEAAGGPPHVSEQLCGRTAQLLGARLVSSTEMEAAISGQTPKDADTRLHVLEASIASPHAISARYAVGTAEDWREGREKRFDELQIDVMDAVINEASMALLAETVRRLAD